MADFREFEEDHVAVAGGELAFVRWPAHDPAAPAVVAVHGITANALAWAPLAENLDGRVRLIAPDLRGRAYSRHITGPWSIDADADDVIAVLDSAGLERAVLAGHSMGGFVVANAAARHPDRVAAVIAIDGGVGLAVPPDADPDAVLEAVVGPAVRKLAMTFADGEAYLDFHRDHPAFAGSWSPQLTAYLARDTLWLPSGEVASSCVEAAIRADGRQILVEPRIRDAIKTLSCPVGFYYAERGILNQPQGLYDEDLLASAGIEHIPVTFVPDVNHYTVLGAPAITQAVLDAVGARR